MGQERASDHCQWLYGASRDRDFCLNPVEPGRVWCREYMEIVYIPESQQRKAEEKREKKLKAKGADE